MPTDLDAAIAARKREAQAETRTLVTMTLVWAIISLGMLVLMLEVVRQYP
jgi:competence protein ComGC